MKSPKYVAYVLTVALAIAGSQWVVSGVAEAQSGATKVRAVDLEAIAMKSPTAKSIMTDFQRFQQAKGQELRKEQNEIEAAQKKLGPSSSQAELQAYGKKAQTLAQKMQKAELEAQQKYVEAQQKVLKALQPIFRDYARDNSIGLLVDSKSGAVVYVDPNWDDTQSVLKRVK